jgi:hypothetical protein
LMSRVRPLCGVHLRLLLQPWVQQTWKLPVLHLQLRLCKDQKQLVPLLVLRVLSARRGELRLWEAGFGLGA